MQYLLSPFLIFFCLLYLLLCMTILRQIPWMWKTYLAIKLIQIRPRCAEQLPGFSQATSCRLGNDKWKVAPIYSVCHKAEQQQQQQWVLYPVVLNEDYGRHSWTKNKIIRCVWRSKLPPQGPSTSNASLTGCGVPKLRTYDWFIQLSLILSWTNHLRVEVGVDVSSTLIGAVTSQAVFDNIGEPKHGDRTRAAVFIQRSVFRKPGEDYDVLINLKHQRYDFKLTLHWKVKGMVSVMLDKLRTSC